MSYYFGTLSTKRLDEYKKELFHGKYSTKRTFEILLYFTISD